MTVIFSIMGFGGLALAVVSLGFAIFLFVKWDIPKVIGELTGHSQKRAIEKIRREGYESSVSKQTSIRSNVDSGNIRAHKTDTDELTTEHTGSTGDLTGDEIPQSTDSGHRSGLKAQEGVTNTVFHVYGAEGEEETSVLATNVQEEEETSVLATNVQEEEETSVLTSCVQEEEETSVLTSCVQEEEETSVLVSNREGETSLLVSKEMSAVTIEEKAEESVGNSMNPLEESTTILTAGNVEGVINIPKEVITNSGTVMKVLDFIITHTDEEVV